MLGIPLLLPEQMIKVDKFTIEKLGIPGAVLMERASLGVVELIEELLPYFTARIVVVSGKGNNGGDGITIGRILKSKGYKNVEIVVLGEQKDLKGDALLNFQVARNLGVSLVETRDLSTIKKIISSADLIVDAIFGTGFKGSVREPYSQIIKFINEISNLNPVLVVSVDIPSGLNGKTGEVGEKLAINADYTVTFQYPKTGFFLGNGPKYIGELVIHDIGIPKLALEEILKGEKISYYLVDDRVINFLPLSSPFSHKGSNGKLGIWAGSPYFTGAPQFCVQAAQALGTGLIYFIMTEKNAQIAMELLETVKIELERLTETEKSLLDALIIGPGLGDFSSWEKSSFFKIIEKYSTLPIILDADALNFISKQFETFEEKKEFFSSFHSPPLLTPHPGELSRLSGYSISEILAQPLEIIEELGENWRINILLKGYISYFYSVEFNSIFVNTTGNESLAKGGSGDILAGIIGAIVSRNKDITLAGVLGSYLLGKVAEFYTLKHSALTSSPLKLIKSLEELLDEMFKEKRD